MLQIYRAPRYALELTIRYRHSGSDEWLHGETLNVSDSGVLFRTPSPAPDLLETLDMSLELSSLGPRNADVSCRGRVVRSGTFTGPVTVVAATIDEYELTRNQR